MTLKIVEESCEAGGARVSISAVDLANAVLILVTDRQNEYRIGTIALAMPITGRIGETSPPNITLFGSRGGLLARALAGKMSTRIGKTVLSIVGLTEDDLETVSSVLKASEKIIEKMQAVK